MTGVTDSEEPKNIASKWPEVVSETNKVSYDTFLEMAKDKYAILLFRHSSKPEAKFFDLCNEYLYHVYHADFLVVWCDFSEVAWKFSDEYADDELRYAMHCKYSKANTFHRVKNGKDFSRMVTDTFHEDMRHPDCITIGRHESPFRRSNRRALGGHMSPQTTGKMTKPLNWGPERAGPNSRKSPYVIKKTSLATLVEDSEQPVAALVADEHPVAALVADEHPVTAPVADEPADEPADGKVPGTTVQDNLPSVPEQLVPEDTQEQEAK
ncbi:hypothetical protein H4S07_001236 [Coemansia furcata]|uniref:Uncharacterized protein n=1 Tax=Coemansia furcata TaxID=417177 RepID=A0ACC1LNY8_9FUNG|nr:hypothetical protein H4S07_001236 [Coemansia furcata]